jgi:hypothetical protein
MVNVINLKSIEKLRDSFRQVAGKNRKKLFEKKENGISFVFNRISINKIGCIKSIKNSIENGFTPKEHFDAAQDIKALFDNSEVIGQWYKKKPARAETHYLCRCKINEEFYIYMPVVTWGNKEGYIDMYLSKDGE